VKQFLLTTTCVGNLPAFMFLEVAFLNYNFIDWYCFCWCCCFCSLAAYRRNVWLFGFAAYCVVADESTGRQVPMAFLERVKDDFVSKYGGEKASTAPPNSLNKEFGY